ncbi:MAG: signal peptidase II [Allobranchiibius sp.]
MQTEAGTPLSTSARLSRPGSRARGPLLRRLALVAAVGYALDQGSKAWAVAALEPNVPKQFVGPVLKLHLIRNPGAAFSVATNATWVLTVIAIAVIAATLFAARRLGSAAWAIAFGLLLAGAFGNLTDRFVREPGRGQGHVIDFLELPKWPIFNVADMCVVTAAALIALLAARGVGIDGLCADKNETTAADAASNGAPSSDGSDRND